jgi:hypothetical protein
MEATKSPVCPMCEANDCQLFQDHHIAQAIIYKDGSTETHLIVTINLTCAWCDDCYSLQSKTNMEDRETALGYFSR